MPLKLAVKLFASVREDLGCDSVAVSLDPGRSVNDLLETLCDCYPEIAARRGGLNVAVNHQLAAGVRVLAEDDDGYALWSIGTYGLGTITVLTVDPSMAPLYRTSDLWRSLLWLPRPDDAGTAWWSRLETPDRAADPAKGHSLAAALRVYQPETLQCHYGDDTHEFADFEYPIRSRLSDIPGASPLPLSWLILFSGLYLLAIGPLDFFVLRWLGREPWTWVTFPLTVVVFSAAALVGTAYAGADGDVPYLGTHYYQYAGAPAGVTVIPLVPYDDAVLGGHRVVALAEPAVHEHVRAPLLRVLHQKRLASPPVRRVPLGGRRLLVPLDALADDCVLLARVRRRLEGARLAARRARGGAIRRHELS